MAFDVALVSPYIPQNPTAGGVAGGKAIFIGAGQRRFAVVDPGAGTVRAYEFTAPAGGAITGCNGGESDGVSVWVAFGSTTSGSLWVGRFWPDGSVDAYPSTYTVANPRVCAVGSDLWVIPSTASTVPRRFDRASLTWDAGFTVSTVMSTALPVALGGYVWCWQSASTLSRISTSTLAVDSVSTTGITGAQTAARVQVADGKAWWSTGTSGRLVSIDSSGNLDNTDTGVVFGLSLCLDAQGFLRSTHNDGRTQVGYNPVTDAAWSESTGLAAYSNAACSLNFAIGNYVVAGVYHS